MDYKQLLIDSGNKMYNSGLTVETWGNISIRDPESQLVYITPTALPYNSLTKDDVLVLELDGNIVEGKRKPTIERDLHLGIMRNRPEINAVVHTHPVYSSIFGVLHEEIPPVIDEAAQIMGCCVKVTEYALPGSPDLAKNCIEAIGGKGRACLLANHGAVCIGADIDAAFKVCTVLELTAKIYYMARSIGKPVELTQEQIDFMHDYAYNHYGK